MPYFILYDISIKNLKSDILIADRELYVSKIYVKYGIIHSSFSDFYHSRYYGLITIFKRHSRHSRTKTTTATQTSKLMFREVWIDVQQTARSRLSHCIDTEESQSYTINSASLQF